MNLRPLHIALIAIILAAFGMLRSGFTIIESGNVGVKSTLGTINADELHAGWHFVVPFVSKIERVFTKTIMVNYSSSEGERRDHDEIVYEPTLMGEDKTGLPLGIDLTVEVKPVDGKMAEMFTDVGRSGFDKMVIQTIRSLGRRVISNYNAETIMTMRPKVEADLESELQNEFNTNEYFKLINVQLKAIVLPGRIREAIEVVAVRKQEAAAAEQAIKTREAEARSVMEVSKGKAEAVKIEAKGQAEAVLIEAEARAKANKLLSESLTSQVLTRDWIDAWRSGGSQMPQVLGGESGQSVLLNMRDVGQSK